MGLRKHVGARLTDEQAEFLVAGDLLGTTLQETFAGDIELARAAWRLHRERLLSESQPGQRPWAWWAFEPPDFRDEPEPPPRVEDLVAGSLWRVIPPREWDILERVRLLSDAEREWLANWRATVATQPQAPDPIDNVVPLSRRLVFPQAENGNGNHKS